MTGRQMRLAGAASYGTGVALITGMSLAAVYALIPYTWPFLLVFIAALLVGIYLVRWGSARADRAGKITSHAFEHDPWSTWCGFKATPHGPRCFGSWWEHER